MKSRCLRSQKPIGSDSCRGCGISAIVAEWPDAMIVIAIVIGSPILGFWQVYRASNAIENLRSKVTINSCNAMKLGLLTLQCACFNCICKSLADAKLWAHHPVQVDTVIERNIILSCNHVCSFIDSRTLTRTYDYSFFSTAKRTELRGHRLAISVVAM